MNNPEILEPEVIALIEAERNVEAIKQLRTLRGIELQEAKSLVEIYLGLESTLPTSTPAPASAPAPRRSSLSETHPVSDAILEAFQGNNSLPPRTDWSKTSIFQLPEAVQKKLVIPLKDYLNKLNASQILGINSPEEDERPGRKSIRNSWTFAKHIIDASPQSTPDVNSFILNLITKEDSRSRVTKFLKEGEEHRFFSQSVVSDIQKKLEQVKSFKMEKPSSNFLEPSEKSLMSWAQAIGFILFFITWIQSTFYVALVVGCIPAGLILLKALSRDHNSSMSWAKLNTATKEAYEALLVLAIEFNKKAQELMGSQQAALEEYKRTVVGSYIVASKKALDTAVEEKLNAYGYAAEGWDSDRWNTWLPAKKMPEALYIGDLFDFELAAELFQGEVQHDAVIQIPAMLEFPTGRPLLFLNQRSSDGPVLDSGMENIVAKLIAIAPPGRLKLTFIDSIGLGENFSKFMQLGDYDDSLITSRAWSEPEHIEKRLKELSEHIETVIQKRLRHEYPTIAEYNRQAGEIAEPYHVVVVHDFPSGFTESSAKRLLSLIQNGPRCGVFPIICLHTDQPLPTGVSADSLQSLTWNIYAEENYAPWCRMNNPVFNNNAWSNSVINKFQLRIPESIENNLLERIIADVGQAAVQNSQVAVPYFKMLSMAGLQPENPQAWWETDGITGTGSSAEMVDVPLGPATAHKLQSLTFGKGTAHHALVAGRTGSGKSNLFHVVISTLAIKYSPDEVKLYLIDFKKGVEFKSYADYELPHAHVIAIESEREFGLSVLDGLERQMTQRGKDFRAAGANDIAEYRATTGTKLPRLILIVDEFQEFFSEDDAIARQSAGILDRLVRQGRSFGIHVMLGSQSLAGSYTLARSTMDQMQIRIALPCSEADSRLILADDNAAARMLSRPGEAIYNSSSGLIEGNNFFQVAMFSDEDREHYLKTIRDKPAGSKRKPIVFEGHEPAAVEHSEPFNALVFSAGWPRPEKSTEVYLGEPIALTAISSMRFRRQGGSNLLVVTREEEEAVGVVAACILSIAAQRPPDSVRVYILDFTTADASWADLPEDISDLFPHSIEVLGRRDLPGLLEELTTKITQRLDDEQTNGLSNYYLVVLGLQRARDLRSDQSTSFSFDGDDSVSLSSQFASILREGPEVGIHSIVWCDTFLNLDRTMEPRALIEFGTRLVGSMSQDDSIRLLDDAVASRIDRPHRMIKYDEDQVGVFEKFRPFRIPTSEWLEHFAENLRSRQV